MNNKLRRLYLLSHPLLCFPLFGAGAFVLGVFVFPLIHLCSSESEIAKIRVRHCISWGFRLFIAILKSTGRIRVHIEGSNLPKTVAPALILANHPMLIDVVFLISLVPDATCVVKGGIAKNPFLRMGAKWAGYIFGDSEQDAILQGVRELQAGKSLIIFPEGTRSSQDSLQKFKRGAATIALISRSPIVPTLISVDRPFLGKGQKWSDFSELTNISISFKDPIDSVEIVKECRNNALSRRKLTKYLQDFFEVQLYHGGRASA